MWFEPWLVWLNGLNPGLQTRAMWFGHCLSFLIPSLSTLSHSHSPLATVPSVSPKLVPVSGPLHLLYPLPGHLSPGHQPAICFPSGLSSSLDALMSLPLHHSDASVGLFRVLPTLENLYLITYLLFAFPTLMWALWVQKLCLFCHSCVTHTRIEPST